MHDIKRIRQEPEWFDEGMQRRGLAPLSDEILTRDRNVRERKRHLQEFQREANEWAKKIGELKSKGKDASEAIDKSTELKKKIAEIKQLEQAEETDIPTEIVDELLITLPNIPDDDVPVGNSEEDNIEIVRWGDIPEFSFQPKEHWELGENLGLMDFAQTAKISGSRFATLKGDLAKMERALAQMMLEIHTEEYGYEEISAPYLVRDDAMFGSGQLPKFAEESFSTDNGYRLIPTSEVTLVNMVSDSILEPDELPIRLVAHTPCFRSEAGAAGRDTRGMIRLHQFSKVELVSITKPEESEAELERLTGCAEEILKRLKLPYRKVLLCTQDMGFAATRTYDLEVWLPGQINYREISSCSNCRDFQARRMKSRYRVEEGENHFVHTLNGSGLAVGRCLLAIMENYQNEDGSITVPYALRQYMGKDIIGE